MKSITQKKYLTSQLATYIGNKRDLLKEIENDILFVCKELNKEKLVTADLFSGTGVVARLLKLYSTKIIANDLEEYSYIFNSCFLSNKSEFNEKEYLKYLDEILKKTNSEPVEGIIRKNYSPVDDKNINENDRTFYSNKNATFIDSFRHYIDECAPEKYKKYFLALLLIESSIHVNTCGVFKGFYKDKLTKKGKFGGSAGNALNRILGKINIGIPVLSENEAEYELYKDDAVELSKNIKNVDLLYLDPPYNQHPYGSNYFMFNIILNNSIEKDVSVVSGIPVNWKRSLFNKKISALNEMEKIISSADAKYILISYNNEGFISFNEMTSMLEKYGKVNGRKITYQTFRGSRNLNSRNIYTKEYLFLLKKEIN